MSQTISKLVGSYCCQLALKLCMQARELCAMGDCKRRGEICGFISTLCSKNGVEICGEESANCKNVSSLCAGAAKGSEECRKADSICQEARKLCPYNYVVHGE